MASSITIRITTDNAAFGDNDTDKAYEVARILAELASTIREVGIDSRDRLRDINGNTVGSVSVED